MDETKAAPGESSPAGSATQSAAATDASKNTLMGVLAYIGPLVIISYITAKDEPFVKFHVKQGLVLLVIEAGVWVLSSLFWFLFPLWQILNVIVIILAVLGIIHAAKGKEKALPFVGGYSKYFTF